MIEWRTNNTVETETHHKPLEIPLEGVAGHNALVFHLLEHVHFMSR